MEESERLSSILIFYNLWTLLTSVVLLKTVPGIIHLESKSKTIYCIHNLYLVESLGFLTQIQLRLNLLRSWLSGSHYASMCFGSCPCILSFQFSSSFHS